MEGGDLSMGRERAIWKLKGEIIYLLNRKSLIFSHLLLAQALFFFFFPREKQKEAPYKISDLSPSQFPSLLLPFSLSLSLSLRLP